MSVTIWHNPACGSSKNALDYLSSLAIDPIIYLYLKQKPDQAKLQVLLEQLQLPASALLRPNEQAAIDLGLYETDAQEVVILKAMADNAKLIQRPVVIGPKGAVIARPKTLIDSIL